MKYYSEKLKRLFDSEKELLDAEIALQQQEDKKELSKKALAQKIEAAEDAVEVAYQEYDKAKNEAAEILEKSNNQVIELLNVAKSKIAEAEKARTEAIVEFNRHHGTYRANYTGEKAKRESDRVAKMVNDMFSNMLFPCATDALDKFKY